MGGGHSFRLRALEVRDVAAVLAIQSLSAEVAQWKAADYTHVDQNESRGWVIEAVGEPGIAGFLVARRAADEMEIQNLAVHPNYRRQGAASGLLKAAFAEAKAAGAVKAFLEVRESNARAIAFYRSLGFVDAGRRAKYYTGPDEDALILVLELH